MYTILIENEEPLKYVGNFPSSILEDLIIVKKKNVIVISTYSNTIKVVKTITSQYGINEIEWTEFEMASWCKSMFPHTTNGFDDDDDYDDDDDTDAPMPVSITTIVIPANYVTARKTTYLTFMLERKSIKVTTNNTGNCVITIQCNTNEEYQYLSEKVQEVLLSANYSAHFEKDDVVVAKLRNIDEGYVNRELSVWAIVTRETKRVHGLNITTYIESYTPVSYEGDGVYQYGHTVNGVYNVYKVKVDSCGIMYPAE